MIIEVILRIKLQRIVESEESLSMHRHAEVTRLFGI